MWSAAQMIILSILIFSCIPGIIFNSSIVAVYFRDWKNGISLGDCDQVLLTMGLTNLILQCLFAIKRVLCYFDFSILCAKEEFLFTQLLVYSLISINFWHMALLSFYYCMKLINCSYRLYNQMKMKISSLVTYLQLVSIIGSCAFNIPIFWNDKINIPQNKTLNSFCEVELMKMDFQYLTLTMFLGCGLPMILTLIFIGFSLTPVLVHIWRMKRNASGFQSPRIEGHLRAARTMVLLVLVDLIFYVTNIFHVRLSVNQGNGLNILCLIIVMSYPSAQSIILILGNPKLRSAWPRVHRQDT